MWRDTKNNPQTTGGRISNIRWRLVVAVVFLFAGALVYRLFSLQIRQADIYTALAANQQQVNSRLKPERGKILLTEKAGDGEKTYPIATNKDFAVLYAVPKDVRDARGLAERFYDFFDRPLLEADLKKMATATATATPLIATSTREEIISGYEARFNRPAAVYDPLGNKRLDVGNLVKLYATLLSATSTPVRPEDLEFKNNQVVYKRQPVGAANAEQAAGQEVKISGLGFNIEKMRYYPDNEVGAHLLGFVSYVDGEGQGRYGLEEFFNEELFGKYGSLKSEKGGQSGMIIVNDREYVEPEKGADLILTVDRNVEFAACEKLRAAVKKHGATGGSVVVVQPQTGAIIAMCSVPDFNPNNYKAVKDISVYNNPALLYQYEPGSVFKTVTMSIALDQGKVSPSTTYQDDGQIMIPGWSKPVKNSDFTTHGPHGIVDMNTVLEYSLNTGAIFAMRQAGPKAFMEYVKNYGFGEKTGIELGAESTGNIDNILRKKAPEIDIATASFGQGIAATPLQMIMPYQAIANGGVLMKPYIVKSIVRADGSREDITPQQIRRVVSAKTAATVAAMLVNVVELGHAKRAYIDGYYVGGKTGTAQVAEEGGYSQDKYIHTFVGIAPIDNPAFVMLTKIDDPKDVQYAEGSALPLWTEMADFMLKYYQVSKTRN